MMITWTQPLVLSFEETIKTEKEKNALTFFFEGVEFSVDYAEYALTYLKERFNGTHQASSAG